jgi:uncharacterized protein (DUF2236 family)
VNARGSQPKPLGAGSVLWQDMGDTLFLAVSSGAAFMLQVMHPTIATAVDRHSAFREDPLGRTVRSADSVMLWVYGGEGAIDEGKRLRELHRAISGIDEQGVPYSALDPEAYAWVHATAFVSMVTSYPLARGRTLNRDEQERLYQELLELGAILRVPQRMMPGSSAEYWDYYEAMVRERLRRTAVAEELLAMVSAPSLSLMAVPLGLLPGSSLAARLQRTLGSRAQALRPFGKLGEGPAAALSWPSRRGVGELLRMLLIAGMTADAREVLGVHITPAQERALRSLMAVARPAHRALPDRLRYMPLALHAHRHARESQAIRGRARPSVA